MYNVLIKYFDPICKVEIRNNGNWIDLCSREDIGLKGGEVYRIPLGVAMKLPYNTEAHLAPRSSTFSKYGILQTNSVGVVDESYCGDNDEWLMEVIAMRDTHISKGDRVAQFRIMERMPTVNFHEREKLDDKDRGGFGTTGY